MTTLERTAALTPNADSATLEACVQQAEGLFMAECGRSDVPDAAQPVIVRMAQILYGRVGAEGLTAQSFSGQSETFAPDWPDDLRRAIHRYRRAAFV